MFRQDLVFVICIIEVGLLLLVTSCCLGAGILCLLLQKGFYRTFKDLMFLIFWILLFCCATGNCRAALSGDVQIIVI